VGNKKRDSQPAKDCSYGIYQDDPAYKMISLQNLNFGKYLYRMCLIPQKFFR
jgi:hypothetical protein